MAITSRNVKLETKHNKIEIETVDDRKVDVVIEEKCDEENEYQVGVKATLRLSRYEVEELYEALGEFRD